MEPNNLEELRDWIRKVTRHPLFWNDLMDNSDGEPKRIGYMGVELLKERFEFAKAMGDEAARRMLESKPEDIDQTPPAQAHKD